jgi:Lipid-droplet associated hydrolase
MARDEMEMITEDRWDEDIWGVEHPDPDTKQAIPNLVFYFGQKVSFKTNSFLISNMETDYLKDHWVADHTRDSLIAARGEIEGQITGKPKMLIDEDGIPHGFCISKF